MKRCWKCKKKKQLTEFPLDRRRKDGHFCWCKKCHARYRREYLERHPEVRERTNRQTEENRKRNPEKYYLQWRSAYLLREYGISLSQYQDLINKQKRRCAICKRRKRLYIDHDHNTDKVRGLLCVECNTGLGKLGDSEIALLRALKYLRRAE